MRRWKKKNWMSKFLWQNQFQLVVLPICTVVTIGCTEPELVSSMGDTEGPAAHSGPHAGCNLRTERYQAKNTGCDTEKRCFWCAC